MLPHRDDARHVFRAIKNGSGYFITTDEESILNRAAEIEARFPILVRLPSQLIENLDGVAASWAHSLILLTAASSSLTVLGIVFTCVGTILWAWNEFGVWLVVAGRATGKRARTRVSSLFRPRHVVLDAGTPARGQAPVEWATRQSAATYP
jgi:hypothetical protein